MHRSGTSLVTRVLEKLGVFVGRRRDHNYEAEIFLKINDWLLREGGASWSNPQPVRALLENSRTRALYRQRIKLLLQSFRTVSFLGMRKALFGPSLFALREPWGWKDPRNTFTLPIWLDIFPDAKVVNVSRHGVDVAASVVRRHEQWANRASREFRRYKGLRALAPLGRSPGELAPCSTMDRAFALWEEYMEEGLRLITELDGRSLQVKYEDLLEHPASTARELGCLCGLRVTEAVLEGLSELVRSERAYSYRAEPELAAFAKAHTVQLACYGYAA